MAWGMATNQHGYPHSGAMNGLPEPLVFGSQDEQAKEVGLMGEPSCALRKDAGPQGKGSMAQGTT